MWRCISSNLGLRVDDDRDTRQCQPLRSLCKRNVRAHGLGVVYLCQGRMVIFPSSLGRQGLTAVRDRLVVHATDYVCEWMDKVVTNEP